MFSLPFTLTISGASAFGVNAVNAVPIWSEEIPLQWAVNVGEAFNYTLPEITDPEEDDITVTVEIGRASTFMTYDDGLFKIQPGATTEGFVGIYQIKVSAEDSAGSKVDTKITLAVLSIILEEVEEELVEEL